MIAHFGLHGIGASDSAGTISVSGWLAVFIATGSRNINLHRHIHSAAQFTGDSKALQGQQYQQQASNQ